MKLSQLLSVYPELLWGDNPTGEVKGIYDDSRSVEDQSVFVAVKGTKSDGHAFLKSACEKGASALVVEDRSKIPANFKGAIVEVDDSRVALNLLASRYYGEPAKDLFCVGVTGTNGKTSIIYLVEHIFKSFGWKTGVMGTINHHLEDHVWESQLTTPGTLQLQKRLGEFAALGARAAVFEVSSHAIDQRRVESIPFDVVAFTNLTRDHLDYHHTMENYFATKQKLFTDILDRPTGKKTHAVINVDDPYGRRLRVSEKAKKLTFGQGSADLVFKITEQNFSGSRVQVKTPFGDSEFFLACPGSYYVYNAMAALGIGLMADVSLETCLQSLESFAGVSGRLQPVPNSAELNIFIDYAHTDDGLRTMLSGVSKIREQMGQEQTQIITVFGCGGDRDRGKRPVMMQAAKEFSDLVFFTNDNPRDEDPEQIVRDAIAGIEKSELDQTVFIELDRKEAIRRAINSAKPGDVVIVAGKGHENYQIIKGVKNPFSDVDVVREILNEK